MINAEKYDPVKHNAEMPPEGELGIKNWTMQADYREGQP